MEEGGARGLVREGDRSVGVALLGERAAARARPSLSESLSLSLLHTTRYPAHHGRQQGAPCSPSPSLSPLPTSPPRIPRTLVRSSPMTRTVPPVFPPSCWHSCRAHGSRGNRLEGARPATRTPCAQVADSLLLAVPLQNILFVFTSHDQFLSGKPTGWYLCVPTLALKCSARAAVARSPGPASLTSSLLAAPRPRTRTTSSRRPATPSTLPRPRCVPLSSRPLPLTPSETDLLIRARRAARLLSTRPASRPSSASLPFPFPLPSSRTRGKADSPPPPRLQGGLGVGQVPQRGRAQAPHRQHQEGARLLHACCARDLVLTHARTQLSEVKESDYAAIFVRPARSPLPASPYMY